MPYIEESRRNALSVQSVSHPINAGELNYMFTFLANQYIKDQGKSYAKINDVLGAFEGAKQEFYRRIAVPYEETKRAQNGDVY